MTQKIAILDFGSQYTQLIARKLRELGVFCEIFPPNVAYDKVFTSGTDSEICGVILSGGPASVYDANRPQFDKRFLEVNTPLLGICYGMQLMVHEAGGQVAAVSGKREYGFAKINLAAGNHFFRRVGIADAHQVWMSHGDSVTQLPKGYAGIASSTDCPFIAIENEAQKRLGFQFHPEVHHTHQGREILEYFARQVCQIRDQWNMHNFIEQKSVEIKANFPEGNVVCAVSGGVDSTVLAVFLKRVLGQRVYPIYINNGMMRAQETERVVGAFENLGMPIKAIEASQVFLDKLKGVSDPEKKRKIIGHTFIEIFDQEAAKIPQAIYLAQGTLYPDVIESMAVHGPSDLIKTHHNVGGLPEDIKFKLIEPFRLLFKDEVRALGHELGIEDALIYRHPFPGPGLAIRIMGEVTQTKLELLRKADQIFVDFLHEKNIYRDIWQAGAILTNVQSVGVMGDNRTYESVLALRAVNSVDGMTADWYPMKHEYLKEVALRIINQTKGINRVVYDISSKPPATIEWE